MARNENTNETVDPTVKWFMGHLQRLRNYRDTLKTKKQKAFFDRFWKVNHELILEALPGLKYTSEMKAATDEEFITLMLIQMIDLKATPAWCPLSDDYKFGQ